MKFLLFFVGYAFLLRFVGRFCSLSSDPCDDCPVRLNCTPEHKSKCKGVRP